MKKGKFILTLLLATIMPLCTACDRDARNIFAFTERDASFTLTVESEYGDISCSCTREGELITATVFSPERSAGCTVTVRGSACTLSVGGADIALSNEAAAPLTCIFDLMFRGDSGATVSKSADGESTVISYEDGKLTLDGELMPAEVNCGRKVKISSYLISD